MGKSECNIVRDVLPLYADDVVCADTKEWVERHIAGCPECAAVLEEARRAVAVPVETDISALKRFKRHMGRGRIIAAVCAALAMISLMGCALMWLCTVDIIEYDGHNVEIYEVESGYGLVMQYNGRGDVGFGFSTQVETGVSSLVVSQVRWKKYIEPIFRNVSARYYLTETDRTLRVEMQQTGVTLWEADEQQKKRYYERREAEERE